MCRPVAAAVPPDGGTERHARSVTRVSMCSRVTGGREPTEELPLHRRDALTRNMYTVQVCAGPERASHTQDTQGGRRGGGCWFCSRWERGGRSGEPRGGMHTGGTDTGTAGWGPPTRPSPRGRPPSRRRVAKTPGSAVIPPSSKRCEDGTALGFRAALAWPPPSPHSTQITPLAPDHTLWARKG